MREKRTMITMKIMDDMIGELKAKHGKDLAIKLTFTYNKYLVFKKKKEERPKRVLCFM